MDLAPGTVLLGKYRVDEVLGTGGMGKVLRASHLYLQQSYAIKILLPHMADSASTVSRFLREAQATVALRSEHIAKVWDVGTMPGAQPTPFIVMEYLDGNDLNQILRHHGPQAPAVVCELVLQACEGLAEAHAMGVIHRDIKPSNFFITRRADGTMLLKILDFGISKTPVGVTDLTGTQTVLGTPTYMAPEQMKTSKTADARADIWSIGVVMYQLITGRPPFSGESYAELVLKVNSDPPAPIMVPLPPGLGEVIMRCLEKNPLHRTQTVAELARQLAPYAADPIAAAQSAARTTRILQHRNAQQGVDALPLTTNGGLSTPAPLVPAQLTPRSWPPTNPSQSTSSLSHGHGQVTHRVRGSRGWLVAGLTALVVVAGAGGFVASRMLAKDAPAASAASMPATPSTPAATSSTTATASNPAAAATPATSTPATPTQATPTPAVVTPALPAPTPTLTPKVSPTVEPEVATPSAPTRSTSAKSTQTKATQTKATSKASPSKSTQTKSTQTKSSNKSTPRKSTTRKSTTADGDLFDSRK